MKVEEVNERQKIFEEGDEGDKFYIVLAGRVTVYKSVKTEIGTKILVGYFTKSFNLEKIS